MLSEVTQNWLHMLSVYGWIWIIPVVERLIPIRHQKFIRPGMLNDVVHTYNPVQVHSMINAALYTWLIIYAQENAGQGPYLRGSLANLPLISSFISLFLVSQLTYYITHYCSHKIPLLWQIHRVHHSSSNLDSLSTSRFHVLDQALFAAPYMMMITYFQPEPGMALLYFAFRDFWGRALHGNIRTPHWLGYIMTTPTFHRWHHSNNPEAIDKNFGAEFNFLDYLFGTVYYPKDKTPENFGEGNYSNNIVIQNFRPIYDIYNLIKYGGFIALFRKPKLLQESERNVVANVKQQ
jgi:sterol desaturase/sphingolipid hydroxylase (fatty acid hydroxylase superfamily)